MKRITIKKEYQEDYATGRLKAQELVKAGTISALDSFLIATPEQLLEVCNGCGAADSWIDYVPDSILDSYIGYACFIHDWEYYVGRTKKDKKEADKNFKGNLLSIVKSKTNNVGIIAFKYFIVYLYFFSVRKFGKKAFWKGKVKP